MLAECERPISAAPGEGDFQRQRLIRSLEGQAPLLKVPCVGPRDGPKPLDGRDGLFRKVRGLAFAALSAKLDASLASTLVMKLSRGMVFSVFSA